MVRTHRHVRANRPLQLHRMNEREIGEMRSATVGIVEDVRVAGERRTFAYRADGFGHGAEVHGDVRRLSDHSSLGVEQRSGCVASLADVG